ncbi:MAG: carboxymuconolactone decarboxylase family protein [Pseudomonadota bacterium]
MSIELLKNKLLESAKDIKLNLSTLLTEEGSPDLSKSQIGGIALASAYAIKNAMLIDSILSEVSIYLTEAEINAAKSAATVMAMNNIYYRFIHLVNDSSFSSMPAKLRMNVLANPGIDKIDFELSCLSVSAINGCGMCIEAHTQALIKAGISKLAIQSSIRIAAVLNATAMGIEIAG